MGIQRVLFRFVADSGFIAGAVRVAFMSVMMILAAEARAHDERTVSGTVLGSDGEGSVNFATIYFKDTHYGTQTADDGSWTLTAPEGDYVLVISAVGYGTVERPVRLASTRPGGPGRYPLGNKTGHGRGRGDRSGSAFDGLRGSDGGHDSGPDGRHDSGRGSGEGAGRRDSGRDSCRMPICHGDYIEVILDPENEALDEAVVTAAGGVGRVKRSAFNAVAVDVKGLGNSTQNLSDALTRLPGMKLRESGGVGSDMQLMLDGFSGRHVKVFIDGVPQEGVGSSFSLNNIPVNFAERIEVYKGVVPVGFGTDALGGVINIVTNRNRRKWFVDASYSYGSFNTHKSYVNFGQTFDSGIMYEINAFQNYSDNNYWVDTSVEHFNEDGTTVTDESVIERVRRFNDTYHNEAIIGKVGLVGKKFADRMVLSFTYSRFYKEIQTGVRQEVVFGQKHRRGWSLMPSFEYKKRNLFTRGLDVTLTAGVNDNVTRNIDTSAFHYNWLAQTLYQGGAAGEQNYQNSEFRNFNWNVTFNAEYRLKDAHVFTVNHVTNSFTRKSRNDMTSAISDYTDPKTSIKNIAGLSYRLSISPKWNLSVFGKYYGQHCSGPVSTSSDGLGNYVYTSTNVSSFGYGAAGTWFIIRDLQAKLSYEKAYRLPTIDELFGDEDLEMGSVTLRPENSDNVNFNVNYTGRFGRHRIYAEGSLIYRHTQDYIMRRTDTQNGGKRYASYENHGKVVTKGFNVTLRYSWSHWISVGGTFSNLDVRNRERYVAGGTLQESLTYGVRIPNQPYLFANADASFTWRDCIWKGNDLMLTYDNSYVHSFPLYWENIGSSSTKRLVPTQFSHNLTVSYSIGRGRYNISFECRNLTDAKLYDNFSLQKAGRAFYGKLRIYLEGRQNNHHKDNK